jgi:hypothetical protein
LVGHEASARAGALDGFAGVGLAGGVHVSLVCYLLVICRTERLFRHRFHHHFFGFKRSHARRTTPGTWPLPIARSLSTREATP